MKFNHFEKTLKTECEAGICTFVGNRTHDFYTITALDGLQKEWSLFINRIRVKKRVSFSTIASVIWDREHKD